jgi:hypothetical protein
VPSAGASGAGTVSIGTTFKTGSIGQGHPVGSAGGSATFSHTFGVISGLIQRVVSPASAAAIAYSTSANFIAGANGKATAPTPGANGGVGGAVVVEWVS